MKIVFIDWDIFVARAVLTAQLRFDAFPPYLCAKMLLGCLGKIGLNKEDKVIIAANDKNCWRKNIDPLYKNKLSQLKEKWRQKFDKYDDDFSELLESFSRCTPFNVVQIGTAEAMDIIATGVQVFKDECIVLTSDPIFEQIEQLENVKIFSPISKRYKIVKKSQTFVAKKLKKGFNKQLPPELAARQIKKTNQLINLFKIPEDITVAITSKLGRLDKEYKIEYFRFEKLITDFQNIYDTESKNIVTVSDSFKKKRKYFTAKDNMSLGL